MQEGGRQKAVPPALKPCSRESTLLRPFLVQKSTCQSTTLPPNWQQPRQRNRRGCRLLLSGENELSYCQRLPAAAQTTGTAGMFLRRQKLAPGWVTYQQFTQEMYQTRQHDAQQNRNMILGSSVFVEECFDFDWRSTYKTDFQRWPGAYGGYCRANKSLSHIFPEDEHLNQNHWVSEYKDSYSISLRRLNRSSQIPAVGLYSGLSPRKRIAMGTAQ
ncbi:uncharacterized protein LOC128152688 [Harpia harpyja]|uniref:uncharacterized protein LOC128152688 n=1 Tax=Harpia harpyja TaxID=202280 RepID=UPI0022B1B4AF|nr:uncharacterized protein LOC128152688 [Harpia harpyja]